MSVQLGVIPGERNFDAVELMAPDFDAERVWLWLEEDGDNRIDLSREQARALRDLLTRVLERER